MSPLSEEEAMEIENEKGAADTIRVGIDATQMRADLAELCDTAAAVLLEGCSGLTGTRAEVRRALSGCLIDLAGAFAQGGPEDDGEDQDVSEGDADCDCVDPQPVAGPSWL